MPSETAVLERITDLEHWQIYANSRFEYGDTEFKRMNTSIDNIGKDLSGFKKWMMGLVISMAGAAILFLLNLLVFMMGKGS